MATTKQRPGGLGRGLGELFVRTDGENPASAAIDTVIGFRPTQKIGDGSSYASLQVSQIVPNPSQPRQSFDEESLDELAASIKEVGLLQPIVVREVDSGAYELVMGERRWRAHQRAGLTTIPAIIRATDQSDMLRDALLENLHRAQLNPLEEAAAYQQMIDDFGLTQDELADKVKKSRPHIANTIRLLRLPPTVQRRVAAGVLSAGHARALLGLSDSAAQEQLAGRIVAEGLSVRATEEAVMMTEGRPPKKVSHKVSIPGEPDSQSVSAEAALTEALDTRIRVRRGRGRGSITIEFADVDDLERIVRLIVS